MAVGFDNSGIATLISANAMLTTFNVSAAATLALAFVTSANGGLNGAISGGITAGGTPMSAVASTLSSGFNGQTTIYQLVSPPTGAAKVFQANFASSIQYVFGVMTFTGSDLVTPLAGAVVNNGTNTSLSASLSPGAGDMGACCLGLSSSADASSVTDGQTGRQSASNGSPPWGNWLRLIMSTSVNPDTTADYSAITGAGSIFGVDISGVIVKAAASAFTPRAMLLGVG